jgi:hypothetical protein
MTTSSWQTETGHLACHWSEIPRIPYHPRWMQEASKTCSLLPSIPDFASRSPFGGVRWFQPNPADPQS